MIGQHKCGLDMKLLLEAIARLRSVQDIPELWQETAQILGSVLDVNHCLILERPFTDSCAVVAEYDQEASSPSMLGQKVSVDDDPDSQTALTSLDPVCITHPQSDRPFSAKSLLIMATSYNWEANGLIYLDRDRDWTEAEREFVRQLAEQVGYYIAHLYAQEELQSSRKKLAQATSTIENFLENINDKLRNPLNGIICSLNLVLDEVLEDPAEQRDFLQDAHHSSIKLLHIVNDLLHFANLRSHPMSREMDKPVKLTKVFQEVERLTKPRADYQKLYLDVIKPDNFDDLIVSANESRLLQVFLNVVGNAIKFTHSGGVTISCETIVEKMMVNDREYPGWVEILVSDTGIGVPSEYLPRIFDPFFQVHDPRTSPYPGTGLGLSIGKKLIEIMGGEINFYSMGEGLGSTVIFSIPLDRTPVKISAPSVSTRSRQTLKPSLLTNVSV